MHDQPAPSRDGATAFTLREAAAELGILLNTLRLRIAAGQIDAERVHRPQGHVWQAYLHGAATQEHRSTGTVKRDGATVEPTPTARAEAMVSLIQTTIATVLGPLVAELAASRQTIERQASEIADLREERGRQSAVLERAASAIVALGEENAILRAVETGPAWRDAFWWLWSILGGVLAAAVVVLIVRPVPHRG